MAGTAAMGEFVVGACVVDPQARRLRVGGNPAKLGAGAFDGDGNLRWARCGS